MKTEKIKRLFSKKGVKSVAVFTSLVLIALAVYLNYRWFYDPTGSIGFGDNNMDDNYQDSTATGGSGSELDYFAATALDRQESRDEALDVLKLVCESEESSAEAKAEAQAKMSKIAVDIQNEANIETLVKAKGFEDCVAVISEDAVSVIVSAESLKAAEAAQILSIVLDTTGIEPEKVSIINR